MREWLDQYPKRAEAALLDEGFDIGFFIPHVAGLGSVFSGNLKSAREAPEAVLEKLEKEVGLGRMAGPFSEPPILNLRISPLGLVPKKEIGKFRMIHHLSYPPGESVNDGIGKEEAAVSYVSFDRAVSLVARAGPGALLAKSDIESAFRLLPVHPSCFHLLGCQLGDHIYIDLCLPMGCSISCKYFEVFSSFLEWVVKFETGFTSITHYLDDFLFVGPADSPVCSRLLQTFRYFMGRFGVPLSEEKTEGPVSALSFLGIEIDTIAMEFRLPEEKLARLQTQIDSSLAAKKVTLKFLQSLLGLLNFACKIMPMGRVFSRRLSLATVGVKKPNHFIRLSKVLKDDLRVWQSFLAEYNGRSYIIQQGVSCTDVQLFTGASSEHGFGAVFGQAWMASPWPSEWNEEGYTKNQLVIQLFPIVAALSVWLPMLKDKRLTWFSGDPAVVSMLNSLTSSSLPVLALLRHLVFLCLSHNVIIHATLVPDFHNKAADALSCLQWRLFKLLRPEADRVGQSFPASLWDLIENK